MPRLTPVLVLAVCGLLAGTAQAGTCQNGIPPSNPDSAYIVHGNGTATDTRTGLMWKQCLEGQTWNGSTCTGSTTGMPWAAALAAAETSGYAGHDDWRPPNLKELRSLAESCRVSPAINDTVFPNTPSSYVWSGSPYAGSSYYAWSVNSGNGDAYNNYRANNLLVRLVRGGQSFAFLTVSAQTVGSGGTISPATQAVGPGAVATFTVSSATGWHVASVSGDTCTPVDQGGGTWTASNITADCQVAASFAVDTFTLTYSAGGGGQLTGATSQSVNYGADGTPVTAVPDTGHHFVQWSDNSTANPRTDTGVTGNISVQAEFAIDTFTLTYSAGAGGSITGNPSQTVNYGGSGSAVTAVPNAGYGFVQWSDGNTSATRTDSNVQANLSVEAQFEITQQEIFSDRFEAHGGAAQ